jgi:hypothetical protein
LTEKANNAILISSNIVYFDLEGGISMATSSIFANVRIDDPKKAEAFIDAYVDGMEHPKKRDLDDVKPPLMGTEEIRRFMSKGDKD